VSSMVSQDGTRGEQGRVKAPRARWRARAHGRAVGERVAVQRFGGTRVPYMSAAGVLLLTLISSSDIEVADADAASPGCRARSSDRAEVNEVSPGC